MLNNLAHAFRLFRNSQVGLVGAGGKSAAMFRLGRDLEPPVILSCSAHLGSWQLQGADEHHIIERVEDLKILEPNQPSVMLLTGPVDPTRDRAKGLTAEVLDSLHQWTSFHKIPLLIEADGARQLSLKAPSEKEPALPDFVNTVIVSAGLSVIGQPLDERHAYGAGRIASLTGMNEGETVNMEAIVALMVDRGGGLKNIPPRARRIALLNQADTVKLRKTAAQAVKLLFPAYDAVAITSLSIKSQVELAPIEAVYEPVSVIVLAAGGSRRMQKQKLLLEWRGEPLIRHTVRAALAAEPAQVIVVTGAQADEIETALDGLEITTVYNRDWQIGQSTSVKSGLKAIAVNQGAAVFMLGDQPQIGSDLVRALIDRHAFSHSQVIAPYIASRRGNPVLFDRSVFDLLNTLQGDAGGRQILDQVTVEALPWTDESIFLDLDSPEDFRQFSDIG